MGRYPLIAVLVLPMLLSGCGSMNPVGWFQSEKPNMPPAKLVEVKNQIQPRVVWKGGIGGGTDKKLLKLAPAIEEGRVYLANAEGEVVARNARGGQVIWRRDLDVPASGGPGVGSGLVLVGTRDAEVIALGVDRGDERWRARVSSEVLSVPQAAQGVVVVHTLDGKVTGLDAASGAVRWTYFHSVPVLSLRGSSSPVIVGDSVICGFSNGKLASLGLQNGELNWEVSVSMARGRTELDRMVDIDADPLVIDQSIYVVTFQGDLAAISLADGSVRWRRALSSYSGLSGDSQHIYVTDAMDHIWSFNTDSSDSGWKQSQFQYRRLTAPVPYRGYVVMGDYEGYLHWLRTEDGSVVGRTRVGSSPITAAPVVRDGLLYVYGDGGDFAAISLGGS